MKNRTQNELKELLFVIDSRWQLSLNEIKVLSSIMELIVDGDNSRIQAISNFIKNE